MLAVDYRTKLDQLIHSIDWKIKIPDEWADYFEDTGRPTTFADDQRHNQRLKIRTCGILWFEKAIPMKSRTRDPIGIYTRDFSRQGTGFLSPCEIYPEEHVRIVLSTFWVQLRVARARRINSQCYEIGAVLSRQHEPGSDAFFSDPHPASV